VQPAEPRRHAIPQPAGLAQQRDQPPRQSVDVFLVVLERRDLAPDPRLQLAREIAVRVVEERPGEERAISHAS
jgi:hypothetical protein